MNKSLENFTTILTAIQKQHDADVLFAREASSLLKAEVNPYDNSMLINLLVDIIASWFEDKENVKYKLYHFIYDTNFGQYNGTSLITIEDNWHYINKKSFLNG